MPRRCLLFTFLLIFCYLNLAKAETVKTSNLLIISGGNSSEYLRETDKSAFDNQQAYFAIGTITLVPRALNNAFLNVDIWGRGVSGTAFFDLTPLVGILDGAANGDDIRNLLLETPNQSPAVDAQKDRENLQAIINKGPSTNEALSLKRQVALDQMISFDLTTFGQLWNLYEGQKKLVQYSLISDINQDKLFQLYATVISSTTTDAKPDNSLPSLVNFLRQKRLLKPVLRTRLFDTTEPHLIGYIFRVPDNALKKTTGQIFIGASGAEAEALTINLEIERETSIFVPWSFTRFFGALFTPIVTSLMGTLLGAVIGFLVFLGQQRYARAAEIEKKFEEKKIEASQKIRDYFTSTNYTRYLDAEDKRQEMENLNEIRKSLIDEGIYSILPRDDINKLNEICRSKSGDVGAGLKELHQLLERRFKELMD